MISVIDYSSSVPRRQALAALNCDVRLNHIEL
jgi:hypothetical protein